jgi:hypothetical protein
VTRLVSCPALVMVVADSHLALPVRITVKVRRSCRPSCLWGLCRKWPSSPDAVMLLRSVATTAAGMATEPRFQPALCSESQTRTPWYDVFLRACMLHTIQRWRHFVRDADQDETAALTRVLATYERHVYVGTFPRSKRAVRAVPGRGRVVLELIENNTLATFTKRVAAAHVSRRRPRGSVTGAAPMDASADDRGSGVHTKVSLMRAGADSVDVGDSDSDDDGGAVSRKPGVAKEAGASGVALGTAGDVGAGVAAGVGDAAADAVLASSHGRSTAFGADSDVVIKPHDDDDGTTVLPLYTQVRDSSAFRVVCCGLTPRL